MSSHSQAILKQIQALPLAEQREVCGHVMGWFNSSERAVAGTDPIRSARGMFAGHHLNDALMRHRQEERSRG